MDDVIKRGGRTELQDIVMQRLDEKHQKERLLMVNMLSQKPNQHVLLVAQASSELERQEQQNLLRDRRELLAPGRAVIFSMKGPRIEGGVQQDRFQGSLCSKAC